MAKLDVIVALDLETNPDFSAVVAAAVRAGFAVHPPGRLSRLGFLAGTIDPAALDELKAVKGVLGVELAHEMPAAPSGSDLQ